MHEGQILPLPFIRAIRLDDPATFDTQPFAKPS
jgi:hypothetical protein